MSDDTIPKEQLKTALSFLEASHGDALKRPLSDEAHAFYHAIGIVEDALNEELLPPDEVSLHEFTKQDIERSREARKQGYEEATLLRERYCEESRKYAGVNDIIRYCLYRVCRWAVGK